MGTATRMYSSGDTYLHLYPGEHMTWGMLDDFQMDLRHFQFYTLNYPRATSFILLREGVEGDVAHGIIGL